VGFVIVDLGDGVDLFGRTEGVAFPPGEIVIDFAVGAGAIAFDRVDAAAPGEVWDFGDDAPVGPVARGVDAGGGFQGRQDGGAAGVQSRTARRTAGRGWMGGFMGGLGRKAIRDGSGSGDKEFPWAQRLRERRPLNPSRNRRFSRNSRTFVSLVIIADHSFPVL